MIQNADYNRLKRALLFLLIPLAVACGTKVALPQYDDFVKNRKVQQALLEIYGNYSVTVDERTFSSKFNLLLDPGKQCYLEILDPSKALLYAVSLDHNQVSMLWAKEKQTLAEKATASNLNAIFGLPAMPDDMLQLIGGYGLDFPQWTVKEVRKDGWKLTREAFESTLVMKHEVSKLDLISNFSPALHVSYENYKMINNQSIPTRIRFEIPVRDLALKLDIEKVVPRDEPATSDLFSLKLPSDVAHIKLFDVYHGKPLILIEPVQEQEKEDAEKEAAAEAAKEAKDQPQTQPQTQTQPH